MPESTPPRGTTGRGESTAGTLADIDQATLRRLSDATTAEDLAACWLELQSHMMGGVTAGVVVFEQTEGEPFAPVAVWPRHLKDRARLVPVVERVIKERRGVVMRSEAGEEGAPPESRYLLGFPVLGGQRMHGLAALEIEGRDQAQLLAAMRQLQWGIAWLQGWFYRQAAWPETHLKHRLTIALEMAALALEKRDFSSAATAFLTEMASRLDCDRVSLGLLKGTHVRVRALSHSSDFKKQMNLIRAIGLAMSESVDQQESLLYPDPDRGGGRALRYHEELARTHGDQAICTVPFINHEGRFFGAITLERSQDRPFDRATVNVCEGVGALVGPILEEKRLADRMLPVVAWDSLAGFARKLVGPRHTVLKLCAAGLLLLVVFFAFATGQFRVTARTTLEGQVRRVVAAPYRGFIHTAPARAGDVVEDGQVLATLDDRDLTLERTRWATERAQYLAEQRRAMADGDLASMKVLGTKMNQAEAQMALLDEQLARSKITAPFRGIVVNGDLSQSLGAPVEAGQILFEIAPLDSYRLSLQVDEWDISHVQPGQTGRLILTALSDERLPFTVTKITPVSLSEEGRSYFKVEARLDRASERLRPGMEGFAKVEIDRRHLIWIWTHDMIDWIRLKLWSWWP